MVMAAMNSAVSGLQAFSTGIDTIGDNIANVSTTAYKASTTNYASSFGTILSRAIPSVAGQSGSNSITNQVGGGVDVSAVTRNFSQGTIQKQGDWYNVAINGKGYLQVKDPDNGTTYATRAGNLRLDTNSILCTQSGLHVQGLRYNVEYSEPKYGVTLVDGSLKYTVISFSDVTAVKSYGEIKAKIDWTINSTGSGRGSTLSLSAEVEAAISLGTVSTTQVIAGAPGINTIGFNAQGNLIIGLEGNVTCTPSMLLLMQFRDENALTHEGNGLYTYTGAGADIFDEEHSKPNTNGLGFIKGNSLEASNVDLTSQFATIIQTQRAFQANSRIITTADEFLQEVVNLKR